MQQMNYENMVEKGEIAHYEQFLLLSQCFQLYSISMNIYTCVQQQSKLFPTYTVDTFWRYAADELWKYCGKGRNCSLSAISPFVTMFSTVFNIYEYIYTCVQQQSKLFPAYTFWRYAADEVWKYGGKRRNCTLWAISPLSQYFQLYSISMNIFIQLQSMIFPTYSIDAFWHLCSRWILKIWWKKEKLLIMYNFSFRHNFFIFIQYMWIYIHTVTCSKIFLTLSNIYYRGSLTVKLAQKMLSTYFLGNWKLFQWCVSLMLL